jgi:hypothetical protein
LPLLLDYTSDLLRRIVRSQRRGVVADDAVRT